MSDFAFEESEKLGVFVCRRVREGEPILYVSHDEDGDWQFLCGGEHGDSSDDDAAIVHLKEIVERDPSLNEIGKLNRLRTAERDAVGSPWRIHDEMEDIVVDNVREHACHVMIVASDGRGPGFAYSIGLEQSFRQPELLCFGLDGAVMHQMINGVRDRMADGEVFADGARISDLIEDHDCVLRRVSRHRYKDFFGYALWFYDGDQFEALQIVWPDPQGRMPWEAGYTLNPALQPDTWLGPS